MESKKTHLFENGHLSDELTACYAEAAAAGGTSDLPEEALNHVEACMDCKDKILELSLFLRNPDSGLIVESIEDAGPLLDDLPAFAATNRRKRKWYASPMRIAATFFLAALMVGTYFVVTRDGSTIKDTLSGTTDRGEVTAHTPPVKKGGLEKTQVQGNNDGQGVTKKNGSNGSVLATPPNFRVNPNLESMIGTGYRGTAVQIFAPRDNSTLRVGGDIVFAWKQTGPGPLTLKIINNKNEVAYNYEITESRFTLKQKLAPLAPGLYYWKLEDHTDLLHLGKFYIK
ncbi:MAG: hypothetical protein GY950_06865 [bacterium]|nr:hypothetical protein [bacterium]